VQGTSNYIWTVPGGAVINSGQGTKNINVNHSTNASATGIITVRSSNACGTSAARVLAVATTNCPRLGDATTQLEVYPNPANSFINLSFNVEQSQQATIILRDAAGRIVYIEAIDAIAGFNNQQIEVSNLAKGVYFVQLQTGDSSENTRLIIE
jgi:TPP-dependent trihydroxycyclohexane-1,2-dione (THcHDO) dehydratase